MGIYHASSLHDLPNETIMHIFDLARSESFASNEDACELGFALRRVSRRMSSLANALAPSFWFHVDIRWEHGKETEAYSRTRACLAASNPDEIMKIVIHAPVSDYTVKTDSDTHGKQFFEALLPYAPKIRSFDVNLRCIDKLDVFSQVFGNVSMPALIDFRLALDDDPYQTKDGCDLRDRPFSQYLFRQYDAPVLEELTLDGCGLERIMLGWNSSFPALTTFSEVSNDADTMYGWGWSRFKQFLEEAPLLEDLTLCIGEYAFGDFNDPNPTDGRFKSPITCANLTYLEVNECTSVLLQLIHAPKLQALALADADILSIVLFLSHNNEVLFPHLTKLHLINDGSVADRVLTVDDWAHLFRHTPHVTELSILCGSPGLDAHGLMNVVITSETAWLGLSQLQITFVERSTIASLLQQPGGRKFQRIEVEESLFDHDDHMDPEYLTSLAASSGVELIMPKETCSRCLGDDNNTGTPQLSLFQIILAFTNTSRRT